MHQARRRQAEGRKQARAQRRGIEDDFADLSATCQYMQGIRRTLEGAMLLARALGDPAAFDQATKGLDDSLK